MGWQWRRIHSIPGLQLNWETGKPYSADEVLQSSIGQFNYVFTHPYRDLHKTFSPLHTWLGWVVKAKNESRYFPKLAGVSTSESEPCEEDKEFQTKYWTRVMLGSQMPCFWVKQNVHPRPQAVKEQRQNHRTLVSFSETSSLTSSKFYWPAWGCWTQIPTSLLRYGLTTPSA